MSGVKNRPWKIAQIAERDGLKCWLCHERFAGWSEVTIDHAIPRSHGGKDGLHNLRLAHFACNQKRGDIIKAPPKAAQVRLGEWTVTLTATAAEPEMAA